MGCQDHSYLTLSYFPVKSEVEMFCQLGGLISEVSSCQDSAFPTRRQVDLLGTPVYISFEQEHLHLLMCCF